MVILQYIANEDKWFRTFVANRLSIIHNGSTPNRWRHVPMGMNPADNISRGLTAKELMERSRWTRGPPFMLCTQDWWPNECPALSLDNDPELKGSKGTASSYVTQIDRKPEDEIILDRLFGHFFSWYE